MAASVNRMTIIGNLGKDPVMVDLPGGGKATSFSVATTESWKDRLSGNRVEETEWHQIVIYGRLAEVAAKYLKKGHSVFLEGRLKTRKWIDKQGGYERQVTEVIVDEMKILSAAGSSASASNASSQSSSNNSTDESVQQLNQNSAPNPSASQLYAAKGDDDVVDAEIPECLR